MAHVFDSATVGPNIRQPFVARCKKCRATIYFDIDPAGTPGFNGDWGDGHGDYGCSVDNGENSEDGNGHVPTAIKYNRTLYPRPSETKEARMTTKPVMSWEVITLIRKNGWFAVVLDNRVVALFPLRPLAEGYITAVTDDEDREGRAAYTIADKTNLG